MHLRQVLSNQTEFLAQGETKLLSLLLGAVPCFQNDALAPFSSFTLRPHQDAMLLSQTLLPTTLPSVEFLKKTGIWGADPSRFDSVSSSY